MISTRRIRWILKEFRKKEKSNLEIRRTMKVSKSTFYRAIKRYDQMPFYLVTKKNIRVEKPGRKPKLTPIEDVKKVVEYRIKMKANDRLISKALKKEGIDISHYKVYQILKSAGLIHMLRNKRKRRNWVRWERKHSLSLWQTDWTTFQGKWLIVIIDDASRLVVGWGLFDNATSKNSVKVLKEAIKKYGKPKTFLTGRDIQFYASAKNGKETGKTYFQKFLEENGIQHILARVNHPQTCGKIERFFGEVKIRINKWKDFNTVKEVVNWHNNIKPHMSLSEEDLVTPAEAFENKLHHNTKIVKTYIEVS